MRTPRFIISSHASDLAIGAELQLADGDFHHLRNVLRRTTGSEVEVIDGRTSRRYIASIARIDESSAAIKIIRELVAPTTFHCTVIAGLTKPTVVDTIVEKCTEIGVSNISFFVAERSQQKFSLEKWRERENRLTRIAETALKQSGAGNIPAFFWKQDLKAALRDIHPTGENNAQVRLVCVPPEVGEVSQPSNILKVLCTEPSLAPALQQSRQDVEFYLVVGPEGGLSSEELSLASEHRFVSVSLGHKVYRAETAVIAVSVLASLANDLIRTAR